MGNMTANAFPFLQQRVDISTLESLLKGLMTIQAYLPLGAELELELILRVSRYGKDKQAHEAEPEKSSVSEIYIFYFHGFFTTWQSLHDLFAKGLCSSSLKNLGDLEVWGAWQFLQSITLAATLMWALPKEAFL